MNVIETLENCVNDPQPENNHYYKEFSDKK